MNTYKSSLIALVLGAGISLSHAQGAFQNLDFEDANPVPIVGSPYYPYAATAASALPGWSVYLRACPKRLRFEMKLREEDTNPLSTSEVKLDSEELSSGF